MSTLCPQQESGRLPRTTMVLVIETRNSDEEEDRTIMVCGLTGHW